MSAIGEHHRQESAKSRHPFVLEIAAYFDIAAACGQIDCMKACNTLNFHKAFLGVP